MRLVKLVSFSIMVILLLGLTAASCKTSSQGGKGGAAATINGKDITMEELDKEYKKVAKRYQGMPQGGLAKEQENRMKKQMLFNMLEEELITQEAEKNNVEASDKDINARLKQYQAGRSKKEFEEQLKKAGMSLDDLKDQIKKQLLSEKLMEKVAKPGKVTEKEIKKYYEKNKAQFTGPDKQPMAYKDVKARIKQMLTSQKQTEAKSDWLDEVKANSEVKLYFW